MMVQRGRHGSLGAFVAHTELAKKESTTMLAKQEGRTTKLYESVVKTNEAMTEMAKANANMMAAGCVLSQLSNFASNRTRYFFLVHNAP